MAWYDLEWNDVVCSLLPPQAIPSLIWSECEGWIWLVQYVKQQFANSWLGFGHCSLLMRYQLG